MKSGFNVIDSELHLMEPPDLWEKHLPEPFRSRTKFIHPSALGGGARVEYGNGVVYDANTSEIRGLMKRHTERRMAEDPRLARAARNCTPEVWLEGMDLEGVDVAILDSDGNPVPQGKEGEICVRGENVTQGYLNNPSANASAFTEDGWCGRSHAPAPSSTPAMSAATANVRRIAT